MKKWLGLLILTSIGLVLPTYAITMKAHLPKTLSLLKQEWLLTDFHEDNNLEIGEYKLQNETLKNWQQLFTIQKFKFALNKTLSPTIFVNKEIQALKHQQIKAVTNIISVTDREAMVDFKIIEPVPLQQHELQRIAFSLDNKLTVLHYVIKKAEMDENNRKEAIKALGDFDIEALK